MWWWLACSSGFVEAPDPRPRITRDQVAEQFIEHVRRTSPGAAVRRGQDLEVEITHDGETVSFDLSNLWGECRDLDVAGCTPAIERWVRVAMTEAEPAVTLERLRLVLISAQAHGRLSSAALIAHRRPLAGDLQVALAYDAPDTIGMVSPEDLAALGKPPEALEAMAIANMREQWLPLRSEPFQPGVPMWVLLTGDGTIPTDSYDAARLVLHDAWKPFAEQVRGDLLAVAPARDMALYTGTQEPRGPEVLQYMAQAAFANEPHPVSPQIVRWTESGWEPWPR